MFRLALKLGKTIGELFGTATPITCLELVYWREFHLVEPWGDDWQAVGILAQHIDAPWTKKPTAPEKYRSAAVASLYEGRMPQRLGDKIAASFMAYPGAIVVRRDR